MGLSTCFNPITSVIVTHQLQFLKQADKILVLDKGGAPSFFGTFQDLQGSDVASSIGDYIGATPDANGTETAEALAAPPSLQKYNPHHLEKEQLPSSSSTKWQIVSQEEKAVGRIPLSVYTDYLSMGGVLKGFAVLLVMLFSQVVTMICEYWLKWWANAEFGDQRSSNYVVVFGCLTFGCIFLGFFRSLFWYRFALSAASQMHEQCLWAVTHSPLQLFVSNPKGRILNRFAKDQNQVDELLPVTLFSVWDVSLFCLSAILLVCVTFPYMIAILPPLGYMFNYLRNRYLRTSREVKRLEATTRSPIYSTFSATLDGLVTLRAFRIDELFTRRFQGEVDANGRAWFSFLMCSRWLGFRLDLESTAILVLAAYLAVILKDQVGLGLIGFALVYAMNLSGLLQWAVRQTAEAETQMTSVERINAYARLEPEEGYSSDLTSVLQALERDGDGDSAMPLPPHKASAGAGHLSLRDVTVTYRPDLEPVLSKLSLEIPAGAKVGICGRTGSGKSSLISSLLRLNIIIGGDMLLDGVSLLSEYDLESARSLVCVIPQEPHLFSGSIRFNVDPFSVYSDEQVRSALRDAHIAEAVQEMGGLAEAQVEEGGRNLSVGQRQLISLARAILRRCPVVLMDEVTASIDFETDRLIQETIRSSPSLAKATILTVAHRLRTIADSDLIVVLQAGEVVEVGPPSQLLECQTSFFRSLAERSGEFADIREISSRSKGN